jgi:hypothetical protein
MKKAVRIDIENVLTTGTRVEVTSYRVNRIVMQFGFKLAMFNQLKILIVDDEEADRNDRAPIVRKIGDRDRNNRSR